jgi:propanol-preferring alcohol dehydrogenase
MNALVLHAPRPIGANALRLEERPRPVPATGEVLVRVEACGVCHTDLHIVEGDLPLPRLPVVPGHQIVGTVAEPGPGVTSHRKGDRVGIPWLYRTCGTCAFCTSGQENLCDAAMFTGYHADGGFAEFMVVPGDFCHELPADAEACRIAPLLCAGVIGLRALRLSGIRPGGTAGLFGFGASAHLALQILRHWGCSVSVFSRSAEHRRHAEDLGAVWTGTSDEVPPKPLDGAVVFAPAGEIVPQALRVVRKGGTVALAGIHMSPIPAMKYSLVYGERVLRSVANSTREDVRALLKLAAEVPLRADVTVYPLDQGNEALKAVRNSAVSGAAVLRVGAATAAPPDQRQQ